MRLTAAGFVGMSLMALAAACTEHGAAGPSDETADVDLPGVDTHDLTPREKHEFTRYVTHLTAPCADVAAPLATCLLEKRTCPACAPAAIAVAKAVREGMAASQVEGMYRERFDAATVKAIPLDGSPSRGPDAAAVTIVEFADFECPFCQQMAGTLDTFLEERKASVRFVYKFMPLAMHPHSEVAARAAIAAQDQGKFWPMHHALFTNASRLEPSDLEGYAKELGLDLERFRADMRSPATTERLGADRKLADALGVKGTPTLFINGREYDAKADLRDWVDGEIARSKQAAVQTGK